MNQDQFWRNFSLNRELHVSGGFIYDGMHELSTLETFSNADEVFQIVYPLAVGFERLLKVAIVLIEYKSGMDQAQFEKSLISHNHLELLRRVDSVHKLHFRSEHNELLQILGKFYKSYRYDRFEIKSVFSESPETDDLLQYLSKHVQADLKRDNVFGERPFCPDEAKVFLARVCKKMTSSLYKVIENTAMAIPLYTYELRSDSKAFKVFLSEELSFFKESLLWKEILVFLLNSRHKSPDIHFLHSIEPLDLDPGMIPEYLKCLGSDIKKIGCLDELDELYKQIPNVSERISMMDAIGSGIDFSQDGEPDEDA
jgi:hypothetical protein